MTTAALPGHIKPAKVALFVEAAVAGWRRVAPGAAVVGARALQARKRKSAVVRLEMHDGRAIVAKRARPGAVAREHAAYAVTESLSDVAPRCHGWVADDDPRWAWLFTEHVGGAEPSPRDPRAVVALSRWLADVHCRAAAQPHAGLPSLGARSVCSDVDQAFDEWRRTASSSRDDVELAGHVARAVASLTGVADRAEAWSTVTPATLVHGSVRPENVRVGPASDGSAVLVFDWGAASWGSPARDLQKLVRFGGPPAAEVYALTLAGSDWRVTPEDLDRLVSVGELLRAGEHLARRLWSGAGPVEVGQAADDVVSAGDRIRYGREG